MKASQLTLKTEERQISAVQLQSPTLVPNGQLALVSMDLMRELLNQHALKVSLGDLKEQMIDKIDNCTTLEEYRATLSYDLAMLELHANLKAYDDAKFEEKRKGEIETNSIDDMVNRGQ